MQKNDIRTLMNNYLDEKATPEERARAMEFADFMESQIDLEGTLKELKHKYERELGISPAQIKARRKRLILGILILLMIAVGFYFILSHYRPAAPHKTEAPLKAIEGMN